MATFTTPDGLKLWIVLTPCKRAFWAVEADDYESAYTLAYEFFACCRNWLDVELYDSAKHGEISVVIH